MVNVPDMERRRQDCRGMDVGCVKLPRNQRLTAFVCRPNFDTTKSVVTERRIRLLREASQAFTLNSHPASLYRRVCQSVAKEPDDIPLLVFYDCSAADDERDTHGSTRATSNKHYDSSASGDAAPQLARAGSALPGRTGMSPFLRVSRQC